MYICRYMCNNVHICSEEPSKWPLGHTYTKSLSSSLVPPLTWVWVMPSTSMFLSELRKLVSAIMPLAVFQLTSLNPLMITTHSHTVCTCCGGLAKDLWEGRKEQRERWSKREGGRDEGRMGRTEGGGGRERGKGRERHSKEKYSKLDTKGICYVQYIYIHMYVHAAVRTH